MTFKQYFKEAFISPFVSRSMPQASINTGPDQGMTAGDSANTFPSSLKKINIKFKARKKIKKQKKD